MHKYIYIYIYINKIRDEGTEQDPESRGSHPHEIQKHQFHPPEISQADERRMNRNVGTGRDDVHIGRALMTTQKKSGRINL